MTKQEILPVKRSGEFAFTYHYTSGLKGIQCELVLLQGGEENITAVGSAVDTSIASKTGQAVAKDSMAKTGRGVVKTVARTLPAAVPAVAAIIFAAVTQQGPPPEAVNTLKNAFLAKRYDIRGKSYFEGISKYYPTDTGLRNARLNFRQIEETHLMENIIYNEMRMRGWLVDVGNVLYRVRDTEGKQQRVTLEVDFVCNKGSERIYIQSAWKLPDLEKQEQEKRSLMQVSDSFRKIIIVGEHIKPWTDDNGIRTLSIYDFLLSD